MLYNVIATLIAIVISATGALESFGNAITHIYRPRVDGSVATSPLQVSASAQVAAAATLVGASSIPTRLPQYLT